MRRGFRQVMAGCLGLLGSACGGGSSGGSTQGDLTIAFQYQSAVITVLHADVVQPSMVGLEGHAPHCALVGGAVPPGMSLDPASCAISGTPIAQGVFEGDVRLTVPGYGGSVTAYFSIQITSFGIAYMFGNGDPHQPSWGGGYVANPILSGYRAQGGDVLTFSVTGQLPAGLFLDASSGQIFGTPAEVGDFLPGIQVTLQRGGRTVSETTTSVMTVRGLTLSYYASLQTVLGQPYTAWPQWSFIDGTYAVTYALEATATCGAALAPGFSLDTSSGIVSGTSTKLGDTCTGVAATVTHGGVTWTYRSFIRLVVTP